LVEKKPILKLHLAEIFLRNEEVTLICRNKETNLFQFYNPRDALTRL